MGDDLTLHYGWLELMSESLGSAWGRLSGKKSWKKRFIVLRQSCANPDEIYLATYDKDDQWKVAEPKKSLKLFPTYRISKLCNFKGKENCLEVNNDKEQWHLFSEKLKNLDLWATQIQMQSKLSRSLSGRIFSVSGAVQKDMQRIGAAQQRCLLHFTKWGITLALQDSRSILAMWPLKTIRNYEESGQCEFILEAGRRSPMGEGVYKFYTNMGQDREMFNVIDAFVNALLNEQAYTNGKKQASDEEILKTYDQLYKSAVGFGAQPRPKVNDSIDTTGYSHIGEMRKTSSTLSTVSRDSSSVLIHRPPEYHRLYGADVDYTRVQLDDEKRHSPSSSFVESPRGGFSFGDDNKSEYDKLGVVNTQGWGGNVSQGEYDHINQGACNTTPQDAGVYDKIDRSGQASSFKARSQGVSCGMVGFPLREEPSVPYLDEAGSLKENIFRNSIYSPLGSSAGNDQALARSSTNSSQDFSVGLSSRHDSTASEGNTRRKQNGTSFHGKSHQNIADHFMYQVPNATPPNATPPSESNKMPNAALSSEELVYGNSDSLLTETSFVDQLTNEIGEVSVDESYENSTSLRSNCSFDS